jgi:hypothetical protein
MIRITRRCDLPRCRLPAKGRVACYSKLPPLQPSRTRRLTFSPDSSRPERLQRHHASAESLFWSWNNIWLHPDFRDWNIESFLDLIRCSVLVLQGAQDEYGTVKQIEAIRARIPSTSAITNASMHRIETNAKLLRPSASEKCATTFGWSALWIMIWDTSIWRRACSNRSKTRSAQKCHPCDRYIL